MMRFAAAFLMAAVAPAGLSAETLEGVFNTGRSEVNTDETGTLDVKFHPCADDPALSCGSVVRINDPADPDNPRDMPDGSPVLGFTMITDLKYEGEGRYRDGRINAIDESIDKDKMIWYGVKIDALDDGRLKLKGCLAFLCPRTMYWEPVADADLSASATPVGGGR